MRWTLTLCCLALSLTPTLAGAQADAGVAPDDPAAGPGEATTSDPMPAQGTSSVVVDDRDAQLQAEQDAMLADENGGSTGAAQPEEEEEEADSLDHEYQLGLRAGIGVPFMFALRYNDGPRCNGSDPADPDSFCLFVGSTVITFDISFGVTPDVEIVLGGRIGAIGVEPTENNSGQMMLGIRAYISPESIAKVYFAPSLVLDLTPASPTVPNWGDVDFGVRGAFGVVVDPIRYLGLYVEIGVNILFLRSFGISPDVSGGFQIRFP